MTLKDGYHDVAPGKLAMVVTHLEMTTKAAPRGAPQPKDAEFAPLERNLDTYRDLFRRIGTNWLWFERTKMSDEDLSAILSDPKIEFWTLIANGTAQALLELDFRTDGDCELAYFGLTDQMIGTGAGAFLMDKAIEQAWAQDIKRFHLHTCTIDSPQALEFYIRSGFTPFKRQVEIADDPRLIDLHPKDAAAHIPMI